MEEIISGLKRKYLASLDPQDAVAFVNALLRLNPDEVEGMMSIPTIGTKLTLLADWIFPIYVEHRNKTAIACFTPIDTTYLSSSESIIVKVPKGTQLRVDRIYIRGNARSFDSVTFRVIDSPQPVLRAERFWAKLSDVNRIVCKYDDKFPINETPEYKEEPVEEENILEQSVSSFLNYNQNTSLGESLHNKSLLNPGTREVRTYRDTFRRSWPLESREKQYVYYNYVSIGEMIRLTGKEFSKVKGVGKKTLEKVKQILEQSGLSFAKEEQ